jgi:hypothetical protein
MRSKRPRWSVGESTQAAYLDAEAWLVRRHEKETPVG